MRNYLTSTIQRSSGMECEFFASYLLSWHCSFFNTHSTPTALLDQENRIIAMLAGRPVDKSWDGVHQEISHVLMVGGEQAKGPNKRERRGSFISLSFGASYGGGQQVSL